VRGEPCNQAALDAFAQRHQLKFGTLSAYFSVSRRALTDKGNLLVARHRAATQAMSGSRAQPATDS
jgi:hypothetical protein